MIIDANTCFGFWPGKKTDISVTKLLSLAKRNQIDKLLTLSMKGVCYDFVEGNHETFQVAKQYPEIMPVATINPQRYLDWQPEIDNCLKSGYKIFRFFPDLQNWPIQYLPFYEIYQYLAAKKTPVMINVTGNGSITQVYELTRKYQTPTILCNINYSFLAELIVALKNCEYLYAETRMLATPDAIELLVKEVSANKLIFGSGSPFYYPESSLLTIQTADISEEAKKNILGGNIARIIGI